MTETSNKGAAARLLKKICRKAGVTIRDQGLISNGDSILVGLSGGKDSMVMLEVLAERKGAMPFDFNLSAAHISARNIDYRIDLEGLESFCRNLGIEFHHRFIEPDFEKNRKKAPCFICSWHRRKELFKLTKELGYNKLALGHHRQDAVETLLMNMIYHGSISSMPYCLSMFDGRLELIRPLLDLDERIIEEYARINGSVKVEKVCENDHITERESMAGLLEKIEAIHGKGAYNMFKSMGKIFEEYLPKRK